MRAARGERLDVLRKLLRSHRFLPLPRRLLLGEHVAQVRRQREPELEPRVHLTLQMRDALLLAGELLARGLYLLPLLPHFRHLALDGRYVRRELCVGPHKLSEATGLVPVGTRALEGVAAVALLEQACELVE